MKNTKKKLKLDIAKKQYEIDVLKIDLEEFEGITSKESCIGFNSNDTE